MNFLPNYVPGVPKKKETKLCNEGVPAEWQCLAGAGRLYLLQVNASCLESLEATLTVSLLAEDLRRAGPMFYCTQSRCMDCKETKAYPVPCILHASSLLEFHQGQQLQEKVMQKHTLACAVGQNARLLLAVMLPRLPGWLGRAWCSGGAYAMHIYCCLIGLVHK